MTDYLWFCVAGAALGIMIVVAADQDTLRSRILVAGGMTAAGLFIYGLILSVADVVSH